VNLELRRVSDGVFATSRAAMQAEVADVIVFDMDGVLIDVHQSYPVVICHAVTAYLQEIGFYGEGLAVTPEDTTYFKAAGGFNSDWALAQGIVLMFLVKAQLLDTRDLKSLMGSPPDAATIARAAGQYGGGLGGLERALENLVESSEFERVKAIWDRQRITRLAQEFYAGEQSHEVFGIPNETVKESGLMLRERALVTRDLLEKAPFRYGLYTGRNAGEAAIALKMTGLDGLIAANAQVTEDRGWQKPDPGGLVEIVRALSPRLLIYVGDNLDDWQTAARYETDRSLDEPPCLFCGMLGGSPGPLAYSLFQERGVDLLANSVVQLMAWLSARHTAG
jgi:HAD superfamily hydrolase (TIGR01548 family)